MLVEVTTATDASGNEDATTTEDGVTAILSIPVVVGDDVPSLECPSNVIPMSSGQRYDLDIETYCKVFTVDPRDAADLDFTAEWSQAVDGVDVGSPVGSVVPVTASEDATEGGEAVLTVRAGESNPQEVRFRLAQAPPPRLNPIRVETMEAGQSRTYDMAAYLQAGVANPDPTIVQVQNTGTPGVKASVNGSRLTLTAERDTRGADASFRLVVSDVSDDDPPSSRTAEGRIQFRVIGTPSPPGEPRPYPLSDEVGTIKMGWAPPDDDGGAPLTYYMVREERSGTKQRCDTNECVFRKLKTGGNYSFRVQAFNRVGGSEWSNLSRTARADTQPGRVQNIRMAGRDDGQITVAWDKPSTNTSRILDYTITWPGGGPVVVDGRTTSFPVTGLDNNTAVRLHDQGPERGRLLASPDVRADAAARHAAGARGPGGDRPRVRRQPDQHPDRVAGGAARGPRADGLHRQLHQRRDLRDGLRLPATGVADLHPRRRALRRPHLHLHGRRGEPAR